MLFRSSFGGALLPVESIVRNSQDAELATYVIEWMGDFRPAEMADTEPICFQGTAFAYRNSRHLITCDHVLRGTVRIDGGSAEVDIQDSRVTLRSMVIINPASGGDERSVTIVARNKDRDLALLATCEYVLPRHFSGLESPLNRNERAMLIGYPNWSPGRMANQASVQVLSRYSRSALSRFEISTNIRQGNSGGPVVDLQFRLAGVAQQGSTQSAGNDECLCVSEVDAWVKSILR